MLGVMAALAVAPAIQAQSTAATDSTSIAVGTVLGSYIKDSLNNLRSMGVDVDNDTFVATMGRVLKGQDTGFTPDQASAYVDNRLRSLRPMPADTLSLESQQQFLSEMAQTQGAVVTPSGLVFIVLTEGEGPMPTDADNVSVIYTGRFYDGLEFDHTDTPISFPVSGVTPGFSEGLKMMRPGGTYRIIMPATLGYGPDGIPGAIPGNAALDFEVQLIAIE